MFTKDRLQYQMFARVREYGTTHRQLFPESSKAGKAFAAVAEATAEIEAQQTAEQHAAGEGREDKTPLREALGAYLATIAKASRLLDPPVTGDVFRLPRRQSDEALVASARRFVGVAQPRAEELVAVGLAATFVTEVSGLANRLQNATVGRRDGRQKRNGVQEAITTALAKGRVAMGALDVMIPITLTHNPAARGEWKSARRVGAKRKATAVAKKPAPVTLTVAPAPTAPAAEPAAVVPLDPMRRAS